MYLRAYHLDAARRNFTMRTTYRHRANESFVFPSIFSLLLVVLASGLTTVSCGSTENLEGTATSASVNQTIQEILDQIQLWQQEHRESLARLPASTPPPSSSSSSQRPFVTVAFAQSLDGKMAAFELGDGITTATTTTRTTTSNYPLSGDDSLLLTHALRSIHDGILVGSRTFSIDNPRLTNRLWGSVTTTTETRRPRPIILDAHLRHIQHMRDGVLCRLKNPIVCCTHKAAAASLETLPFEADILACDCEAENENRLCLEDVLRRLKRNHGIETLMVEGGAALLSSLFDRSHGDDEDALVDALCITIAPKLLGSGIAPTFRQDIIITVITRQHQQPTTAPQPHRIPQQ